jgi:membrane peptidoglycan carboxypeptidase
VPALPPLVHRLLRLPAILLAAGALLAATVVALAPEIHDIATANTSVAEEIDLEALNQYAVRSDVFAADGSLLTTLHAEQNRRPITLDQVPQPVIDSILAVEDADFYQHNGVNARAVVRALTQNVSAGAVRQGGSTITQQLVKNALLNSSRDIHRKSKEVVLAFRLEQQLPKDRILETYLNTVYFGAGAYGVQAAAETYWGVDASKLGYAEGALLAALISNPQSYDPTLYPDRALKQREIALQRLVSQGRITQDQATALGHTPLPVRRCGANDQNKPVSCGDVVVPKAQDYFTEEVKQELLADPRLGTTQAERFVAVFGGGLKITTTLDPSAQQAAQLARDYTLPANDKGITAAMVSVEPSSGAVRALVGGPGFDQFQYDIATGRGAPPDYVGRQTGSSFKVFTLLTAMEQGNLPNDQIAGGGAFANPDGTPNPYVIAGVGGTLTSVTQASSNGAFVRLQQTVGTPRVVDMAHRLGIDVQPAHQVVSLTLGVANSTPLQMASAYAAIPNGGIYQKPYFVDRVEDRDGKVLIQHRGSGTRAFSSDTACNVTQILQANVRAGTATRARLADQDAAGKTGTTENNTDAWFVGYTPYLATAVWMGIPQGSTPMGNFGGFSQIFGGTIPAMIWHNFNTAYHADRPAISFPTCDRANRSARAVRGEGPLGGGGSNRSGAIRQPESGRGSTGRGKATTTTNPGGTKPTTVPTTTRHPRPTTPTTSPPPTTTPTGPGG